MNRENEIENKTIETYESEIDDKMEFISDAERELHNLIEDAVIRLQNEYKEKFGGFKRHDVWLWMNCSMKWPMIMNCGVILDEEEG